MEPTYHAVHTTLTHRPMPALYVYGRTRKERYLDPGGALRQRSRRVPRDQWEVLIPDHHPGFTGWGTYQATRPASAPTSGRRPASPAPARSGKAARCCRAWPPAGPAAASSRSSTPARRNACRTTTARAQLSWDAPTTTSKDRKQLLRTLLDEVNITLHRDDPAPHANLVLRWIGVGALSE